MNQDILLSKIVPNATDTTWSQAYTTLNVYMTLSIENKNATSPITSFGKELLEKLQREFFALDDKNLEHIKKAVSNVTTTITPDYKYSIIVGAIVKNILYIVTSSNGTVVIKRGQKIGTIARGEEGVLIGFSGQLLHNDVVVFQTGDFSEKISPSSLQEYLSSSDVSQIAENITPLIHDNSKGTEAAIIIQYKDLSTIQKEGSDVEFEIVKPHSDVDKEPQESKDDEISAEKLWTKSADQIDKNIEEANEETLGEDETINQNDKRKFQSFNFANRKMIGIIIIILIIFLAGGIFYQKQQQEAKARALEFEKVYNPSKGNFDNALSTASINKSEAVSLLTETLKTLNDSLSKFPENSEEYKKLKALKVDIEKNIEKIGGGSSVANLKEIIKANSTLKSIDNVTFKGGDIVIASNTDKKVAIIEAGKIKEEFETEDAISFLSSDDKFIYVLGSKGITQIDRGNGNLKVLVKNAKGIAFEVFSSNLYTLQEDDIRRFRTPSYQDASYFAESVDFEATPIDMSISGSIFVLENGGKIERFTKSKKDDFTTKGITATFSDNAKIYTDGEFENIYILDLKNQRVVSLNNNGEFQNQYEGSFLKDAKSFAIDEKGKTCYVVANNILYSFDL